MIVFSDTPGVGSKNQQYEEMAIYLFVTSHGLHTCYHVFTPRTSFAMQKAVDKGTILDGCCLLLLDVFLPKKKCTATNYYCPSYNKRICRSIKSSTDHSTCVHCGITQLMIQICKGFSKTKVCSQEPDPFPIKVQLKYIYRDIYQTFCIIKPQHDQYVYIFGRLMTLTGWKHNFSVPLYIASVEFQQKSSLNRLKSQSFFSG